MITIHFDFVDNTEVSYIEGLELIEKNISFTTNVLTFFSNSYEQDVLVIDKHGRSILKSELNSNKGHKYTDREMRNVHNIYKMLLANAFTWKQPERLNSGISHETSDIVTREEIMNSHKLIADVCNCLTPNVIQVVGDVVFYYYGLDTELMSWGCIRIEVIKKAILNKRK